MPQELTPTQYDYVVNRIQQAIDASHIVVPGTVQLVHIGDGQIGATLRDYNRVRAQNQILNQVVSGTQIDDAATLITSRLGRELLGDAGNPVYSIRCDPAPNGVTAVIQMSSDGQIYTQTVPFDWVTLDHSIEQVVEISAAQIVLGFADWYRSQGYAIQLGVEATGAPSQDEIPKPVADALLITARQMSMLNGYQNAALYAYRDWPDQGKVIHLVGIPIRQADVQDCSDEIMEQLTDILDGPRTFEECHIWRDGDRIICDSQPKPEPVEEAERLPLMLRLENPIV